jgi:uncharacterized protein YoaH (UPF0181 family)
MARLYLGHAQQREAVDEVVAMAGMLADEEKQERVQKVTHLGAVHGASPSARLSRRPAA